MATKQQIVHLSLVDRKVKGKDARAVCPRSSHAGWTPATDRPDPIALLEAQNEVRDQDLVPVRHGRMMVSPFTFYRGAAKVMSADLAGTPTAGLDVQLCGDAHLSNFGVYGSPERTLVFDLNDFDETLPGPFEWDLKRLAASFTIAARNNGFSTSEQQSTTAACVTAYRDAMAQFAGMRTLDLWYTRLSADEILASVKASMSGKGDAKAAARAEANIAKARTRDSMQALSKLAKVVEGEYRIVSEPPTLVSGRELATVYGIDPDQLETILRDEFRAYRSTLQDDRKHLLERYRFQDVARKVVGVGSVGTRAFIVLLQGRDDADPLFLQIKEATTSVLEDHLPKSRYRHHGQRVVAGQRLMQASSDIFLGWTKGVDPNRHYYWRQLRDMKGSALVELMEPKVMAGYGRFCGWTLARAHARSGDPVAIASYLGSSDAFDRAIVDFSDRYADQNLRDHEAFVDAVRSGRLEAVEGV